MIRTRQQRIRDWTIGVVFVILVLAWSHYTGKELDHEQQIRDAHTTTTVMFMDPQP